MDKDNFENEVITYDNKDKKNQIIDEFLNDVLPISKYINDEFSKIDSENGNEDKK